MVFQVLVTMNISFRALVILSVWVFLVFWAYSAIKRSLKIETTFNTNEVKDSFEWPVINICPLYFTWRNSTVTFEDASAEIQQVKSKVKATCLSAKARADKGWSKVPFLDLWKENQLMENNNLTLDDIFSYGVSATIINSQPVVCTSIDISKVNMKQFSKIDIIMTDYETEGYVLTRSEPFQFDTSLSNEDTTGFDMVCFNLDLL